MVGLFAISILAGITPAAAYHGPAESTSCDDVTFLVIDRSGSMAGSRLTNAKAAANALVDELWQYQRSGLVSFSEYATTDQGLTLNHADTKDAINALTAGGATSMDEGITMAHNNFLFGGGNQSMVVLGDGASSGDPEAAATSAKNDGIRIFSIAVGSGAHEETMKSIASSPVSDHYRHASSASDIITAYNELTTPVSCDRRVEPVMETMVGDGSITLNYARSGATNYQICWASAATGPWTCITTTSSSHTFNGLSIGESRWFKARAYVSGSWGGFSSPVLGHAADVPHIRKIWSNPTSGANCISITWHQEPDNYYDADQYEVAYKVAGSSTWKIETDAHDPWPTTWTDCSVPFGETRTYRIRGMNVLGWGDYIYADPVKPYSPPEAPVVTADTSSVNGAVDLSWTTPASDFTIEDYQVYQKTNGAYTAIGSPTTSNSKEITGLDDGKTYYFAVDAGSDIGRGPMGFDDAKTRGGPSEPLQFVAAQGSVAGRIDLSWDPPTDLGSAPFNGYNIYRSPDSCPCGYFLMDSTTETSYSETGLGPNQTYFYKVTGVSSSIEGPPSEPDSATTKSRPYPPTNMKADAGPNRGEISLTWAHDTSSGGFPTTRYEVYFRADDPNGPFSHLGSTGSMAYTDSGLGDDVTRFYRVAAVNSMGEGGWSHPAGNTTFIRPSPPTAPSASTGPNSDEITVRWSPPVNNGGLPLLDYKVYRIRDPSVSVDVAGLPGSEVTWDLQATVSPSTTQYTDTDVNANETWHYRITASNVIGESDPSTVVRADAPTTPDAPFFLTATAGPSMGEIELDWNAPRNGGISITGYEVHRASPTGSFASHASIGNVTTWIDGGLGQNETWRYRVAAVNGVGEGPQSNEAEATSPTLPAAPSNPNATTGPGVGEITVTWDLPPPNGASAPTSYRVHGADSSGGPFTLIASPTTRSAVEPGLSPGQARHYKVSAVNAWGEGPMSTVVNATAPVAPPDPPNLTVDAGPGSEELRLSWTPPMNTGGAPIEEVGIYRSTTGAPPFANIGTAPINGDYVDTGLGINETVHYRISAINGAGESPLSPPEDNRTFDYPTAPVNLTAQRPVRGQIDLQWQRPDHDGGDADLSYRIMAGPSSATMTFLGSTTGTSYAHQPLPDGATRHYVVTAVNAVGEGPESNEASNRTLSPPSAPQNLDVSPGIRAGEINITWDPPLDDGGSPVMEYAIYRGNTSTTLDFLTTKSGLEHVDTTVPYGEYRYYMVTARNSIGEGPNSTTQGAYAPDVPTPPLNLKAEKNGLLSVDLEWNPPIYDGGLPLTQYSVYQADDASGPYSFVDSVNGTTTNLTAPPCPFDCYYHVNASNSAGEGNRSNLASFNGDPDDFPLEAKTGRTPASGGALKEMFPCPTNRDRSVNVVTGQFVASGCLLHIGSELGLDVNVELTHRTNVDEDGLVGHNWFLSTERHLEELPEGDVVLHDGYGRKDTYTWDNASSVFHAPPGHYDELVALAGGHEIHKPLGIKEVFDATGKRLYVEDGNGNRVSFEYDSLDRLEKIVDAHDRVIGLGYSGGRLAHVEDFDGRRTSLTYIGGDLTDVELPDGSHHVFDYDAAHNLRAARDPLGQVYLENAFDGFGRVAEQVYGNGSFFFAYDPSNGMSSVVDRNANGVVWEWESYDRQVPTRKTTLANRDVSPDSEPSVTTFQHNGHMELTQMTLPNAARVTYEFDIANPDPRGQGNLLSEERSAPGMLPVLTTYTYDAFNSAVASITSPLENDPGHEPNGPGRYTTRIHYGQDELLLGDLNGDGVVGTPATEVVKIVHPVVDPAGSSQARDETFEYNARGQVTRHVDVDGSVTQFTYYASNGVQGDPSDTEAYLETIEQYPKDPRSFPGTPPDAVTSFEYDNTGNLVAYENPEGHEYTLLVDDLGRVLRVVSPAPLLYDTQFQYDDNGDLWQRDTLNAREEPDGSRTIDSANPYWSHTFEYDVLGNVVREWIEAEDGGTHAPNPYPPMTASIPPSPKTVQRTYGYDANGNLVLERQHSSATGAEPEAAQTYIYDEQDRLVSSTRGGKTHQFDRLASNAGVDTSDINDPFTLYLRSDLDLDGDVNMTYPLSEEAPTGNWSTVGSPQLAYYLLAKAQDNYQIGIQNQKPFLVPSAFIGPVTVGSIFLAGTANDGRVGPDGQGGLEAVSSGTWLVASEGQTGTTITAQSGEVVAHVDPDGAIVVSPGLGISASEDTTGTALDTTSSSATVHVDPDGTLVVSPESDLQAYEGTTGAFVGANNSQTEAVVEPEGNATITNEGQDGGFNASSPGSPIGLMNTGLGSVAFVSPGGQVWIVQTTPGGGLNAPFSGSGVWLHNGGATVGDDDGEAKATKEEQEADADSGPTGPMETAVRPIPWTVPHGVHRDIPSSPTVAADVGTIWNWTADAPVAWDDVNVQIVFWAQAPDGDVDELNPWIARLYVDDFLVSSTPENGTHLTPPASTAPEMHRLVLPKADISGTELRLELEAPAGSAKLIHFDSAQAPSRIEIGNAETQATSYDAAGNPVREWDPMGGLTTHAYDGLGRRVETTTPEGLTHRTERDSLGRASATETHGPVSGSGVDALLERRSFVFDEAGRRVREDVDVFTPGPAGPVDLTVESRTWAYDEAGRVVEAVEFNGTVDGATTRHEYDELGRRTATIEPDGTRTDMEHDARGNVIKETRSVVEYASGLVTRTYTTHHVHDAQNNLVRTTDPLGNTLRYGYDSRGNLAWETDARGADITDPLGLHSGSINDHGNIVRYEYDGQDRLVATDREVTSDGSSSTAVVDSIRTTQAYDGNGNVIARTDDTGSTTLYEHDKQGRLVTTRYEDGSLRVYEYDLDGNLIRIKDANGNVIDQEFDVGGHMVRRAVAAGPSSWSTEQVFEYDGLGRMTLARDNNLVSDPLDDSEVVKRYDSMGRVVLESQDGRDVERSYWGIRVEDVVAYPSGHEVTMHYDAGRPSWIFDDVGTIQFYLYEGGRLAKRFVGNGNSIDLDYDGAERLNRIQESGPAFYDVRFDHGLDRMGQRTSTSLSHAPSLNQINAYDSLGRLDGVERPGSRPALLSSTLDDEADWSLDGANNWLSVDSTKAGVADTESRVHDDMHAVTSISHGGPAELFAHDANGNRLQDATHELEWDAFNRLRRVTERSTGDVIAEYAYDALDRRVAKTVTNSGALNGETQYVYDAEDVIAEYDGAALLREYVHGPGYDEPLVMDRNVGLLPDDTATGPGDQRLFYVHDALGSVVALEDTAGLHVEGYIYDAYGEAYVINAGADGVLAWGQTGSDDFLTDASAYDNPYTYTAQRADPETGLMYYKARYYDPEQGRFISRDPIGIWTDSVNLGNGYTYVGNHPTMSTDPTGNCEIVCVMVISAIVVAAIAVTAEYIEDGQDGERFEDGWASLGDYAAAAVIGAAAGAGIVVLAAALAPGLLAGGASVGTAAGAWATAGATTGAVAAAAENAKDQGFRNLDKSQCGFNWNELGRNVLGGAFGGAIGGVAGGVPSALLGPSLGQLGSRTMIYITNGVLGGAGEGTGQTVGQGAASLLDPGREDYPC